MAQREPQDGPPGMQQAADAAQAVTVNLTAPVSLQLIGVAVALALAGASSPAPSAAGAPRGSVPPTPSAGSTETD